MNRDENIVGLDVGTSSVRALLFDNKFANHPDIGLQSRYQFTTRQDGSVEVDPAILLQLTCGCLDALHEQMVSRNLKAVAVGICTFWHCFIGVDRDNKPTTPIVHLFDTRSGRQMEELTRRIEPAWLHAITGCVAHTSYWPAKLLWLKEAHPDQFEATTRWISVGDYLLLSLTGASAESISMVSASGIWDQRQNDYCTEVLNVLGIDTHQLAPVETLDEPRRQLRPEFAARWPLLNGIAWYPALGDGACNSIGSGCSTPSRFALMVGTSGAMRVVVKQSRVTIPAGIWCYRVNRERFILGGAVSNGGEVFRWASRTLRLPADAEEQLVGRKPGSHRLTMLPYFAGERSPYWRPDLRAVISGMSLATEPLDLLQASLESVALSFKEIYLLLTRSFAPPTEVVASGGALLKSKVWLQMMADALGHSIAECQVQEASSRGAAIIAAEQIGLISSLDDVPSEMGNTVLTTSGNPEIFERMLGRDGQLFDALYGPSSRFGSPEDVSRIGDTTAPIATV